MKRLQFIIALGLFVIASPAFAQDPDLKSLDENSDDKISVAEFEAYAEQRLPGFEQLELFAKKVDANSDGEISADEFASRMEILDAFRSGDFDDMEEETEPESDKPKSAENPKTVSAAKDQSGVVDAFKKIKGLVKNNDWAAASRLMTTEGADQSAAQIVTSGLGMLQIELPMSMPKLEDAIEEVDAVIGKHGLDKLGIQTEAVLRIEMGGHDEDDQQSAAEAAEKEKEKAKRKADSDKIIAALDKEGKRWHILGELSKAMASSPFGLSPLTAQARNVAITDDRAILEIKIVPPDADDDQPGMKIQVVSPPMFLNFERGNDQWKFAGLNREKTNQARKEYYENMPDMEFEGDEDLDREIESRDTIKDASFAGTTTAGKPFKLADLKGKMVLVNFWHTKSSKSVSELATLKLFQDKFGQHGLEVVGVAKDDLETLKSFSDDNQEISWPVVVDDQGEIASRFQVRIFPKTLLIDKEGNHVATDLSKTRLLAEIVKQLDLDLDDFVDFKKKLRRASRPKPVDGVDY